MFAKAFSFGGVAVLAAAAVLMTAEPGQAAHPVGSFRPHHHGGAHPGPHHYPLRYYGGYFFYRHHGGAYVAYHPYYGTSYAGAYDSYYPNYGPSYDDAFFDYGGAANAPAQPVLTAEERDVRSLLTASGIPTDGRRPVWPLALRVLPGPEAEALRGQIDALLQTAAAQAAGGRPNTAVVQEMARATRQLRKLLLWHREERGGLARTSYEEAERFLDKLDGARTLLRVELAPAPSGPGGEVKGGSHTPG
jgi:hypothetical protein